MKELKLLMLAAVLSLAPASHAGELFLGVQWGQGSMEVPAGGARVDMDDDGFKGFAGYQFTRFISAELGYTDLGKFSETFQGVGINAEADLFSAVVVGILPATPKLSFFIKAGVADWSTSVTLTDMLGSTRVDTGGNDFTYGGGISYLVGKRVAIRGEWESYELGDVKDVKFVSIGAQFNF